MFDENEMEDTAQQETQSEEVSEWVEEVSTTTK